MRTARLTVSVIAASVVLLSLPAAPSVADDTAAADSTVILTFDANQSDPAAAARAAVTAAGGTDIVRVHPITAKTVAVTLDDTTGAEAAELNANLEAQASVRAADTSARFHPTATDDTDYTMLWNLNNAAGSTYGVDAEDAWPTSRGSGIVVSVLDTGITVHSDLTAADSIVGGNAVQGYDFISASAYSNDGDGYDPDPTDVVAEDDYHGTHVAGTIAAIANNGKGVVGVAPEAKVQPLRVLGKDGGAEEDVVAAIRWAAGLGVSGVGTNPTPASVINMSLGGSGTCSYALQSAINAAVAAGTAVVVATGNSGQSLATSMPANCANVIRVTASTSAGQLAYYSNYGTSSLPATIAAPGGAATSSTDSDLSHWIVSTWHDPDTNAESYTAMVGTSMAAPHVSGVLALMKAANPSLTVSQLTTLLTGTAKPFSTTACTTARCGAGIANAPGAVAAATSPHVSTPVWSAATRVGSRLSATASTIPSSTEVSWQWLRAGVVVAGATGATYTPTVADYGKTLSVRVTAVYAGKTTTMTSAAVKVAAGVFTKTASPTTLGTYKVGRKVKALAGTWLPTSTRTTYQWLRNGKKISGATGIQRKLTKKDKGRKISVRVTVRAAGYTTYSATSASHKVK